MKFRATFSILVFLISASPVWSAPGGNNYSADLVNLNYYPHEHRFFNSAHFVTAVVDGSSNSAGNSQTIALTEFFESLSYGIAKKLWVAISETLLWDQTVDSLSPAQAENTTTSAGPSNPAFTVNYRYLENHRRGFSGDLGLSVTPSLGPSISPEASDGATGNNLAGGWVGQISSEIYWRRGANETELAATAVRYFYSETRGAAGAITVTDPYWQNDVKLVDRIHFSQRHYLQIGLDYTFLLDRNLVSPASVSTQTQIAGNVSPTLLWGYSPDPDIVAQFSVNFHQGNSSRSTISSSGFTTAQSTTMSTAITATLALLHQF